MDKTKKHTRSRSGILRGRFSVSHDRKARQEERLLLAHEDSPSKLDARTRQIRRTLRRDYRNLSGPTNAEVLERRMLFARGIPQATTIEVLVKQGLPVYKDGYVEIYL